MALPNYDEDYRKYLNVAKRLIGQIKSKNGIFNFLQSRFPFHNALIFIFRQKYCSEIHEHFKKPDVE